VSPSHRSSPNVLGIRSIVLEINTDRGAVLVAGGHGQLGARLVQVFADWPVIAHTRATLDVTDPAAVARVVAAAAPSIVINATAFNDVDGAEARPVDAMAVNAMAVRSLARAAAAAGARFVHYGTDFVFDGEAIQPYDERTPPSPRSTYAMSKLLGEWLALEGGNGFVLRVESLFGSPPGWSGRRGTLDSIVNGLLEGRDVRVFTDRVVSPSYTPDVAAATRHLLATGAEPGLYHCVNSGHATWHDVAVEAARLLGVTPRLVPMTMDQVRMAAARPRFCALSNAKLAAAGFAMPTWQDALRRWLAERQ
jgi:dTDP-4-dehydrorhamnose reductase